MREQQLQQLSAFQLDLLTAALSYMRPSLSRDGSTSCQTLAGAFATGLIKEREREKKPKNLPALVCPLFSSVSFIPVQLPDGTDVGLKGAYISAGLCCCWRLLLLGSSVLAGDGGICGEEERASKSAESHRLQLTGTQSDAENVFA